MGASFEHITLSQQVGFDREDDKFWNHEGFDYEAIQKAIEKDIKPKNLSSVEAPSVNSSQGISISPGKKPFKENQRGDHHLENGKGPFEKADP